MTKVLVTGGRNYLDWKRFNAFFDAMNAQNGVSCIIQGGATGADSLARSWAANNNVPIETFKAFWEFLEHPDAVIRYRDDGTAYNAKAGIHRNEQMLRGGRPDLVVAWPGGRGTEHMCRISVEAEVPTLQIAPAWEDDALVVFTDEDGNPMLPEQAQNRWLFRPDPSKPRLPRRAAATPVDRYEPVF